jgi:hypothetical protein
LLQQPASTAAAVVDIDLVHGTDAPAERPAAEDKAGRS